MSFLRASLALFTALLVACSSEGDDGAASTSSDGGTPSNACTQAGGHCLGHNAPSAKGQGPANCDQFGRWFYGGPLRSSPLSCEGVQAAGGVECCVP